MKVEYELRENTSNLKLVMKLSYTFLLNKHFFPALLFCLRGKTAPFSNPSFPMDTERNKTLSNHSVVIVSRCCFYCMDILGEQFGETRRNGSLWCKTSCIKSTLSQCFWLEEFAAVGQYVGRELKKQTQKAFQKHYLWSRTKRPISLLGITHFLSVCVCYIVVCNNRTT